MGYKQIKLCVLRIPCMEYEMPKEYHLTSPNVHQRLELGFVSISEIRKLETKRTRIAFTCPCVSSNMELERKQKYGGFPRFNLMTFYQARSLLVHDDIVDWSHHRKTFEEIRNIFDIKNEI